MAGIVIQETRQVRKRCFFPLLEANLFFNLISETYEKVSIIVTSNKSFESWAEMIGGSVMTSAMLDRLLHHARVFNLDGDSYRIKNQNKEE